MNVTIRSQLQQQARRQGLRFVPNQTSPPDCSSATQRTPGSPDASPSTQNGLSLLRRPDGISPSDFSSSHPLPFFHPARPFCARSVRRSVHVPPNFEPLASRFVALLVVPIRGLPPGRSFRSYPQDTISGPCARTGSGRLLVPAKFTSFLTSVAHAYMNGAFLGH
jgi:hypothetical protein